MKEIINRVIASEVGQVWEGKRGELLRIVGVGSDNLGPAKIKVYEEDGSSTSDISFKYVTELHNFWAKYLGDNTRVYIADISKDNSIAGTRRMNTVVGLLKQEDIWENVEAVNRFLCDNREIIVMACKKGDIWGIKVWVNGRKVEVEEREFEEEPEDYAQALYGWCGDGEASMGEQEWLMEHNKEEKMWETEDEDKEEGYWEDERSNARFQIYDGKTCYILYSVMEDEIGVSEKAEIEWVKVDGEYITENDDIDIDEGNGEEWAWRDDWEKMERIK